VKNILNNSNIKRKGIILVLVITTIGLVGVVILFLSGASNTMMFQANNAYLQACERNLQSSGLNWAKENIKNKNTQDFNDIITLDVNDLNILHSSLKAKITNPEEELYEVQIDTTCGRAKLNLKTSETFKL
jgi:predicted metalloprotease